TRGGPPRWDETFTTRARTAGEEGALAIDEIPAPENPWRSWMRFGALDILPDGRHAVITTWNGDVWMLSGIEGDLQAVTWRRIATGLFQPLGIVFMDGAILVLGRDQITRLHDLNGDGEADYYENFNNDGYV